MAWIKVEQSIRDHRKILAASDELGIQPAHLVGTMVLLWLWALDNSEDGSLGGVKNITLARAAQWDGDPDKYVEILTQVMLLDKTETGIAIHGWYERAGKLIEQRAADSERKRLNREKKKSVNTSAGCPPDVRRTSATRVEKSRVEKSRVENIVSPSEEEAQSSEKRTVPDKEILELWNNTCTNLRRVICINNKRKSALKARWKEHPSLDWWKKYFQSINGSAFLSGATNNEWSATFDWVLKPSNMIKILEGNYADRGKEKDVTNTSQKPSGWVEGFKT